MFPSCFRAVSELFPGCFRAVSGLFPLSCFQLGIAMLVLVAQCYSRAICTCGGLWSSAQHDSEEGNFRCCQSCTKLGMGCRCTARMRHWLCWWPRGLVGVGLGIACAWEGYNELYWAGGSSRGWCGDVHIGKGCHCSRPVHVDQVALGEGLLPLGKSTLYSVLSCCPSPPLLPPSLYW